MGAIKGPSHTGTSEGLSQAINRGPIRKFLPNYANVYLTIQSHGFSAGARTHYVTANGVRNGLGWCLISRTRFLQSQFSCRRNFHFHTLCQDQPHSSENKADFSFSFCFTSYFVFSIAVLPHSPGVVYNHLLLRRDTRIPRVAPFSLRIGIWDLFVHIEDGNPIHPWPLGSCGPLQE